MGAGGGRLPGWQGSLIGSSANLIVAGIAEQNGVQIRFFQFMRVAFPLMLMQVAIATVFIWWRYL